MDERKIPLNLPSSVLAELGRLMSALARGEANSPSRELLKSLLGCFEQPGSGEEAVEKGRRLLVEAALLLGCAEEELPLTDEERELAKSARLYEKYRRALPEPAGLSPARFGDLQIVRTVPFGGRFWTIITSSSGAVTDEGVVRRAIEEQIARLRAALYGWPEETPVEEFTGDDDDPLD